MTFLRLGHILSLLARSGAYRTAHQLGAPPVLLVFFRLFSFGKSETKQNQDLARALEKLGAGFVKIGQLLASRSDIIGNNASRALASLHDEVRPLPATTAKKCIERALGGALHHHFQKVELKARGSASIAQVHYGITHDGQEVAIKILRPNIKRQFAKDFALLRTIANFIERNRPDLKRLYLHKVLDQLEQSVRDEMDLRLEAASLTLIGRKMNLQSGNPCRTPHVLWQLSGTDILTMQWMDGKRIDDASHHLTPQQKKDLVRSLAKMVFSQIFKEGFFHADLHAGNVLLNEQKELQLVDFGITGRLSKNERLLLAMMMDAFFKGDFAEVAHLHKRAGYLAAHYDSRLFALAVERVSLPVLRKPLKDISMAHLIAQILSLAEEFDMEVQPQLLLLQKTLFLLESLARALDNTLDLWSLCHQEIVPWLEKERAPLAQILRRKDDALPTFYHLLEMAHKAGEALDKGVRLHEDSLKELKPPPAPSASLGWLMGFITGFIVGGICFLWLGI